MPLRANGEIFIPYVTNMYLKEREVNFMIQGTIVEPSSMGMGYENVNPIFEGQPVQATVQPTAQTHDTENADDLTEQFKGIFDAFADALPKRSQEEKTAKTFFKKFSDYIGSNGFKEELNRKSEETKIPAKELATNFFLKVLGIIGDILGIVVNTVCNIVDTAIHLLSIVLHGAVDVVSKLANGIISVVTLNQTNLKTA